MDAFDLTIEGQLIHIEAGLHADFYTVSQNNKSAMLGKNENGEWEFALQTSEAISLSAQQIGEEIERAVRSA